MRDDYKVVEGQRVPSKKGPHWGALILNDVPKTNGNHRQLIVQLKAHYRVANDLGDIQQPNQKSEDFSI